MQKKHIISKHSILTNREVTCILILITSKTVSSVFSPFTSSLILLILLIRRFCHLEYCWRETSYSSKVSTFLSSLCVVSLLPEVGRLRGKSVDLEDNVRDQGRFKNVSNSVVLV